MAQKERDGAEYLHYASQHVRRARGMTIANLRGNPMDPKSSYIVRLSGISGTEGASHLASDGGTSDGDLG
jgi:hypothetical protein